MAENVKVTAFWNVTVPPSSGSILKIETADFSETLAPN